MIVTVAPFAGAWIEMQYPQKTMTKTHASLPSRERGLKFAPFGNTTSMNESLPSRERGLKSLLIKTAHGRKEVAPFAGAWIEIYLMGWDENNGLTSLPSRERGLK